MILVLGGTGEAREIAAGLSAAGLPVLATAVTEYGEYILRESCGKDVKIRAGALDKEKMASLISQQEINMVVDATHPFATNITGIAGHVCSELGIKWVSYEREEMNANLYSLGEKIFVVDDMAAAAAAADKYPGGIFLTTGIKDLGFLVKKLGAERIIARVLPVTDSLEKCRASGLLPKQLIAMQGPFSTALNRELFRQYDARVILTKDSGQAGGVPEKLNAAGQLGLPVILIKKPGADAGFDSGADAVSDAGADAGTDNHAPLVFTNKEALINYALQLF